jgi:transketolase
VFILKICKGPFILIEPCPKQKTARQKWLRYGALTGLTACWLFRPGSIGMETFGASAPLKALQEKFGFTPDRVTAVARELITL